MRTLLFLLLLLPLPAGARTRSAPLSEYRPVSDSNRLSGPGSRIAVADYRLAVADYSRRLKAAAARSEAAGEQVGRTRTGYLPQLSLAGNFSVNMRHTEGVRPWTFSMLPRLVQTLYGGGSVRAAHEQAELDYEIALCDEAFSRLEVQYAADYAYWNLSATRIYAAAMREYVAIIRSLEAVVARRFAEGYTAKSDVLMIDTRLSEAEYDLLSAEQQVDVALHDFNILCGAEPMQPGPLAQSIRDSLPMPARARFEEVLVRRPDYLAALLRNERAGVGIRAARASFNPQISAGIGPSWQPHTPNRSGRTYIDGTLFVQLSLPVFHWGERRRAVGAARAARRESEWTADALYDDIEREEMNGWTVLVQTRAQVDASERSLRIAGENLDISTYSYGEGQATILDVLQAQLSWIQLYTNAILARFNYAVAVSDYRRITAE